MTKEGTAPAQVNDEQRDERRYVISTGLRIVEDGEGRSLHVLACVKREMQKTSFEIEGWFTAEKLPTSKSAYCGDCGKPHRFMSLLDAFDAGALPLDLFGDNPALPIDILVS